MWAPIESDGPSEPPAVTVRVPGLLTRFTAGARDIEVAAGTFEAGIETIVADYPALEPHLFDGQGRLRAHLQLFVNGERAAWDSPADIPLEPGDEIVVLQAVSGG